MIQGHEIMWNVLKYNFNENKTCATIVQSQIMLPGPKGPVTHYYDLGCV